MKKKSYCEIRGEKKEGRLEKSLCQVIREKNNILTSTNEKLISTSDLTKPPQPNTPSLTVVWILATNKTNPKSWDHIFCEGSISTWKKLICLRRGKKKRNTGQLAPSSNKPSSYLPLNMWWFLKGKNVACFMCIDCSKIPLQSSDHCYVLVKYCGALQLCTGRTLL